MFMVMAERERTLMGRGKVESTQPPLRVSGIKRAFTGSLSLLAGFWNARYGSTLVRSHAPETSLEKRHSSLWNRVKGGISSVADFATSVPQRVLESASQMKSWVARTGLGAWNFVVDKTTGFVTSITAFVSRMVDSLLHRQAQVDKALARRKEEEEKYQEKRREAKREESVRLQNTSDRVRDLINKEEVKAELGLVDHVTVPPGSAVDNGAITRLRVRQNLEKAFVEGSSATET